jgi:hypothetical protein
LDVGEFRSYLLTETSVWAAADRNFRHSSFVDVVVPYLEDAGVVADFETCYYRGTGSRRRAVAIDGFAFDEADDSLRLFLAEPELTESPPNLGLVDARTMFGRLRAFVDEAFEGRIREDRDPSSPEWGLAEEMVRRRGEITRIRAFLLTDRELSATARDWPEGEVAGVPLDFHIWDINRFLQAHTSIAGRDDIELDFSDLPGGGLPCIEAGSSTDDYLSYLCVVPGDVLASLYEEHGSRLLEGNVRSFLTTKRKVNTGIRNTILHESRMFFAYNNGIGATAESAEVRRSDGGLRLVRLRDLQIVNGGQTTVSIASARRNDRASLELVYVPMKVSVVPPERAGDVIPNIARYANSQNPVSEADFFSNHAYHRRLEEISRRISVPARSGTQHETRWFYERARGQYMNATFALSAAQRRRFLEMNPREQVLTKTDLAKSENAWNELPHTVSKGAQKNFMAFANEITKAWTASPDSFHEDYFRAVVARVVLFRSLEKLVSAQPWYSGGYRANVVAYSMAKLAAMVRETAPTQTLDTRSIWDMGAISPALSTQLAKVALAMHEVIIDSPAGVQNVTEWSKREACWVRAKAVGILLDPAVVAELVSQAEQREVDRVARTRQKLDTGIGAQEAVVGLGQAYWAGVREWGRDRGFVLQEEESLLRMAAEYVPGVPGDFQSKKLLALKKRFEVEGMAPRSIDHGAS